jgi:drug/metabolite transporter (DMT)-like permease
MSTSGSHSPRVVAIAILYVALFSSAFMAIRIGVRSCPPLTLLMVRSLLAAAIVGGIARWLGLAWPATRVAWGRLIILGILQALMPAALNFIALRHVTSGTAAIINASNPLLLTLVAPRLLGEGLSLKRMAGVMLGFGGVVFVMRERLGGTDRVDTPVGVVLVSLSVVSIVTSTIFFKRYPPREPLLVAAAVQSLAAGLLLLPVIALFENPMKATINVPLIASLLWMVFGVSIGAFLIWFWLLARGEASVATSYLFLTPIFGLMYGAIFLNERFTIRDGAGLVAVCGGIILMRGRS